MLCPVSCRLWGAVVCTDAGSGAVWEQWLLRFSEHTLALDVLHTLDLSGCSHFVGFQLCAVVSILEPGEKKCSQSSQWEKKTKA